MNYVAQPTRLGCLIAAAAMVFDISYERAGMFIPLPQDDDLQDGENVLADLIYDRLQKLAAMHGKEAIDLDDPPWDVKRGLRYIALIPTGTPHLNHSVAIDEEGIVFDPDPDNQANRRPWTEYPIIAMLEFRPPA